MRVASHSSNQQSCISNPQANMSGRVSLLLQLCLVLLTALARAASQEPILDERPIYSAGDSIPVECRAYCLLLQTISLLTCLPKSTGLPTLVNM